MRKHTTSSGRWTIVTEWTATEQTLWILLEFQLNWICFISLKPEKMIGQKVVEESMILSVTIYTLYVRELTHWGRVTHICISDLTSIGSDNGLSPGRRQAIIRTNAGILLIRPLGTSFSEFLVEILIFSFKKMRLKVSSAKRRPFCLGLDELIIQCTQCTQQAQIECAFVCKCHSQMVKCHLLLKFFINVAYLFS